MVKVLKELFVDTTKSLLFVSDPGSVVRTQSWVISSLEDYSAKIKYREDALVPKIHQESLIYSLNKVVNLSSFPTVSAKGFITSAHVQDKKPQQHLKVINSLPVMSKVETWTVATPLNSAFFATWSIFLLKFDTTSFFFLNSVSESYAVVGTFCTRCVLSVLSLVEVLHILPLACSCCRDYKCMKSKCSLMHQGLLLGNGSSSN